MPKLRVRNLAMSVDGYVAGPDQSLDDPLGVGGRRLHDWVFETRFGREMIGEEFCNSLVIGVDRSYKVARKLSACGIWKVDGFGRGVSSRARDGDEAAQVNCCGNGETKRFEHNLSTTHKTQDLERRLQKKRNEIPGR